jgi:methylenetetrahydrofolate--tRNA-(uracil-5-)-methyltransferase
MNVNFGLFPPVQVPRVAGLRGPEKALQKKRAISARALADLEGWLSASTAEAAE